MTFNLGENCNVRNRPVRFIFRFLISLTMYTVTRVNYVSICPSWDVANNALQKTVYKFDIFMYISIKSEVFFVNVMRDNTVRDSA